MIKETKSKFIFEAIIFAVALVVTLPLRTLQYMNNVEEYTGFYKTVNANVIVWVAVLAAASLCFIVSAFMSRNKISLERKAMKLPGMGIFSALAAVGILWSAVEDFLNRGEDYSQYTVSSTASTGLNSIIIIAALVLAVLSAVYFGVLAINFITGREPGKIKLMSLFPVLWSMARIVERITRTISYLRVSDLALEMVTIAAMIIFFMAFAEANSDVNTDGSEWRIVGLGLTSALLALNLFIPRAVLILTKRTEYMYILSKTDVSDMAIALFILATIYIRIVPKITNVIEEAPKSAEETESEIQTDESDGTSDDV